MSPEYGPLVSTPSLAVGWPVVVWLPAGVSSVIVTVVWPTEPICVPLDGPVSESVKSRVPAKVVTSAIGTVIVREPVSPAAQVSVPDVAE